jgi:ABC-type multidrug transport system fused ATPase/permease subunit
VEDTVRDNLFAKKSDDELEQALVRVRLHDAELGKIATKLSIGQKQRVGLARLLLDRADIVLLDEPLSGVDAFTLMELDEELRRYFGDDSRTFVVISHRLMFTSYADHVVVIEDGVKVEEGSPTELRDKPDGRFAALVSAARTEIGA